MNNFSLYNFDRSILHRSWLNNILFLNFLFRVIFNLFFVINNWVLLMLQQIFNHLWKWASLDLILGELHDFVRVDFLFLGLLSFSILRVWTRMNFLIVILWGGHIFYLNHSLHQKLPTLLLVLARFLILLCFLILIQLKPTRENILFFYKFRIFCPVTSLVMFLQTWLIEIGLLALPEDTVVVVAGVVDVVDLNVLF